MTSALTTRASCSLSNTTGGPADRAADRGHYAAETKPLRDEVFRDDPDNLEDPEHDGDQYTATQGNEDKVDKQFTGKHM